MSTRGHHGLLLAGASPVLWTPANLPVAPKVWVDWDSALTEIIGYASAWSNSKGSLGGSFSQSTASYQPSILVSGINGKRALRFDGSEDRMQGPADVYRDVTAGWSFIVFKKRTSAVNPATGACILYGNASSNVAHTNRWNVLAIRGSTPGLGAFATRRGTTDATAVLGRSASDYGNWTMRRDVADWANGDAFMYVNGTLDASDTTTMTSGNTSNDAMPGLMLGTGGTPSSPTVAYSDIDVALVMCGSGASLPSTGDFEKIEGWAAWQLGLEANLPIGHPYKSSPPYV